MTPFEVGIAGVILLFVLLFLGIHIGVGMGLVGFLGLLALNGIDSAMGRLGHSAFSVTSSYIITVIPLFMLMGEFAFFSGLTKEAYEATHKWLSRLPGGMAMATVGGCAAFAAVCGSNVATASTMFAVSYPQMKRYGYGEEMTLGSIAAGGTIGILIPPSNAFIIYGLVTEQSIGKLFLAGILPGILLTILFASTIYLWAKLKPATGPVGPRFSWRERLKSFQNLWAVIILFVIVMGGIYSGLFTATEAAAIGAFAAFVIGFARRRLNAKNVVISFFNAIRITGMIFMMIIGATLFGYFLASSGVATALMQLVIGSAVSPTKVMLAILILFFFLGCFFDAWAIILIIVPILYPAILKLGFDPIWFGVILIVMVQMGLITPPIGMNALVVSGMAKDVPTYTTFRGIIPFCVAMVVCVIILWIFPSIATFLPSGLK
ncbi:TRAP transporter large permease [Thermodesulfobacteriota bacterium]